MKKALTKISKFIMNSFKNNEIWQDENKDGTHITGDELLLTIFEEEKKVVLKNLFEAILCNDLGLFEPQNNSSLVRTLVEVLSVIDTPFTIIQEFHHIDQSYRDAYYSYFSNQHFKTERYSRRLNFFKGAITLEQLFNKRDSDTLLVDESELQEFYIGSMVINPLDSAPIGKTLIDASAIIPTNKRPVYVRTSEYTIHVYGHKLKVHAFPYRMQDGEMMTCAEVTLLNIIDYYSNSFADYRKVVPSEIKEYEKKHFHERVLPSSGMSYPLFTKVLSEFGFSPRLYNKNYIHGSDSANRDNVMKRLMHYYVDSGIPVAVNMMPSFGYGSGHSVVCFGYGNIDEKQKLVAFENKVINYRRKNQCHPLVNSADFYSQYAIVDDNAPIYQLRTFPYFADESLLEVAELSVPLYKRMFMDAADAESIFLAVLQHDQYGIDVWLKDKLEKNEDVIFRIFLASSHGLKQFRSHTLSTLHGREVYALTPMPRFVWVCELFKIDDYDKGKCFGECIIDATSVPTPNSGFGSLIMLHYMNQIYVRYPERDSDKFHDYFVIDSKDCLFPHYSKNLTLIN